MITAFILGTVVAFVLAMPPGPVGISAIKTGIEKGIKPALELATGTGIMDFIFCLAAIFTTSVAVGAVSSFTKDYPFIAFSFQLAVITALILFGTFSLKKTERKEIAIEDSEPPQQPKLFRLIKNKGPFLIGIGIALTNIANPTFLPSLAYVTLWVQQFELFESLALNNFAFALGFGLGNFLWLWLLVKIVLRFKNKMSDNFIIRVKQVAGITFISFGGLLGWRLLVVTKWTELFRLVVAFL